MTFIYTHIVTFGACDGIKWMRTFSLWTDNRAAIENTTAKSVPICVYVFVHHAKMAKISNKPFSKNITPIEMIPVDELVLTNWSCNLMYLILTRDLYCNIYGANIWKITRKCYHSKWSQLIVINDLMPVVDLRWSLNCKQRSWTLLFAIFFPIIIFKFNLFYNMRFTVLFFLIAVYSRFEPVQCDQLNHNTSAHQFDIWGDLRRTKIVVGSAKTKYAIPFIKRTTEFTYPNVSV